MVRSTWSEDGDHGFAQRLLNTGYRMTESAGFPDIPSYGCTIAYGKKKDFQGPYFPSVVTMGQRGGVIGQHAAQLIQEITVPLLNDAHQFSASLLVQDSPLEILGALLEICGHAGVLVTTGTPEQGGTVEQGLGHYVARSVGCV